MAAIRLPTHFPPFAQRFRVPEGEVRRFPTGRFVARLAGRLHIVVAALETPRRIAPAGDRAEKKRCTVSTSIFSNNLMKLVETFRRKAKFTMSTS